MSLDSYKFYNYVSGSKNYVSGEIYSRLTYPTPYAMTAFAFQCTSGFTGYINYGFYFNRVGTFSGIIFNEAFTGTVYGYQFLPGDLIPLGTNNAIEISGWITGTCYVEAMFRGG